MDACTELVALIDRLAQQGTTPRVLLVRLGAEAAGIRPGPSGLIDLARGGRNILPGGVLRAELDDDSGGQIRHFAGIAALAARVGPRAARLLSFLIGRDHPHSPDGQLTHLASEFSRLLFTGELTPSHAAQYVHRRLCGDQVDPRPRAPLSNR